MLYITNKTYYIQKYFHKLFILKKALKYFKI